jgi:hypothetical protein
MSWIPELVKGVPSVKAAYGGCAIRVEKLCVECKAWHDYCVGLAIMIDKAKRPAH